jgi:hypothetical protein
MNPREMRDQELVEIFADLAIRSEKEDLDLIGSGRRFSVPITKIRKEIFSRMVGGENEANKMLLQNLADSGVKADSDHQLSFRLDYIESTKQVLAVMPEKQNDLQVATV